MNISYFTDIRYKKKKKIFKINLILLVILFESFFTIANLKYNKRKKMNNKIDIIKFLIEEGIDINDVFKYGRNNEKNIGNLYDIMMETIIYQEQNWNICSNINSCSILKLLMKNNLKIDYTNKNFLVILGNLINSPPTTLRYVYDFNNSKKLKDILYYTKIYFYSKYTEDDLFNLIKISNQYNINPDITMKILNNVKKIRYNNFTSSLVNDAVVYCNIEVSNNIKNIFNGTFSKNKFYIITICILFINKLKKK